MKWRCPPDTGNSSPGGLRPSTIPLGRGGSPQYLLDWWHQEAQEVNFITCERPAICQPKLAISWVASDKWHLRSYILPQKHLETSATIMEIHVYIRGGGGGRKFSVGGFFAIDVVPVKFTIYSLSRLTRKMVDIYPSSHFVWHTVPPVPQLVQEYWCNFNAGTLPFPYGKETALSQTWHFTLSAMTAWW